MTQSHSITCLEIQAQRFSAGIRTRRDSKSVKPTAEVRSRRSAARILSPASRARGRRLNGYPALKRWAIVISSASRTISTWSNFLGKKDQSALTGYAAKRRELRETLFAK